MTPTVQDIITIIEDFAPADLAESWDNSGLMIGHPARSVRGILLGLDPTLDLLEEACSIGANLVITHHPIIFHPLDSIRFNQPDGRFIETAISEQISIIGCHTNLDSTTNGISDVLADELGLRDIIPLVPGKDDKGNCGLGRIGNYETGLSPDEFIVRLREACAPPWLLQAGPRPEKVDRVAVCGGSCSDLAPKALAAGVQVFVTAEIRHNIARWAEDAGLWLIDGGHFSTELPGLIFFAKQVRKMITDRFAEIHIRVSGKQTAPLTMV